MDNKTVIAQKSGGFYAFYIANFALEIVIAVILILFEMYFGKMGTTAENAEALRIIYICLWLLVVVDLCSIIYHGIVIIRHIMRKKDIVTYFGGTFTFNKTDISIPEIERVEVRRHARWALVHYTFGRITVYLKNGKKQVFNGIGNVENVYSHIQQIIWQYNQLPAQPATPSQSGTVSAAFGVQPVQPATPSQESAVSAAEGVQPVQPATPSQESAVSEAEDAQPAQATDAHENGSEE